MFSNASSCVFQVLRALRGEQNFIRVEAVPQGHFLHKKETEKSPTVAKAGKSIVKHFRAVAEIGSLPFLPPFTVIGPPYGGILRPDEEIRLMMVGGAFRFCFRETCSPLSVLFEVSLWRMACV